jgi:hypothetical protein
VEAVTNAYRGHASIAAGPADLRAALEAQFPFSVATGNFEVHWKF